MHCLIQKLEEVNKDQQNNNNQPENYFLNFHWNKCDFLEGNKLQWGYFAFTFMFISKQNEIVQSFQRDNECKVCLQVFYQLFLSLQNILENSAYSLFRNCKDAWMTKKNKKQNKTRA